MAVEWGCKFHVSALTSVPVRSVLDEICICLGGGLELLSFFVGKLVPQRVVASEVGEGFDPQPLFVLMAAWNMRLAALIINPKPITLNPKQTVAGE